MKKTLIAMALVFVLGSAAAHADEGVVSGPAGVGTTQLEACSNAKINADHHVLPNAHVTGHSACDCSQNDLTKLWTCTVETQWKTNGS